MKNLKLVFIALLLSVNVTYGQVSDTTTVKGLVVDVFETKLQKGEKIGSQNLKQIFLKLDDKANTKLSRKEFYCVSIGLAVLVILINRRK